MPEGPVVIEARDVAKSFFLASHRVDTLKERVVRPFAHRDGQQLEVLRGVSFDVHEGEFFGIVGRNGSGKSTLLKVLASIYRADRGSIRIAGALAPFIELGVGFDPDLTARDNVRLSGVLAGMGRRAASRRLDGVLDFAELREHVDVRLKNYSSGMLVRLAFATMIDADADVMLVDEVLAVGDAAFAARCLDVFRERHAVGRTIVLVTHDMATVQAFCDRAMVLHDGDIAYLGEPEEAALRYYRANFQAEHADAGPAAGGSVLDVNVRVVEATLRGPDGSEHAALEQGEPLVVDIVVEARHELEDPVFNVHVCNEDGAWVLAFSRTLDAEDDDAPPRVPPGGRVRLAGTLENPLLPGRYVIDCWISRRRAQGDVALHVVRLLDFIVFGTRPGAGSVSVEADVEMALEPAPRT